MDSRGSIGSGDHQGSSEEIRQRLESRDLDAQTPKGEKKPLKKGFIKSEWLKTATTTNLENAGKTGAREQIRAQVTDTDITIQVIRQGAWSRALSVLLSPFRGSIGKKPIIEIHVERGSKLIDVDGNINVMAVQANIKTRLENLSTAKSTVANLIEQLDSHAMGPSNQVVISGNHFKEYARLKTDLIRIKNALARDDALDKIVQLKDDINVYKEWVEAFIATEEESPSRETIGSQKKGQARGDPRKLEGSSSRLPQSRRNVYVAMPPAPKTQFEFSSIAEDKTGSSNRKNELAETQNQEAQVEISYERRQQGELNDIYKSCYDLDPSIKGRDELLKKTLNLMLRKSFIDVKEVEIELEGIKEELKTLVKRAEKGKEKNTTPTESDSDVGNVGKTESEPIRTAQEDLAIHLSSLNEFLTKTPKEDSRYALIESAIKEIETEAVKIKDKDIPGFIHMSLEYISSLGRGATDEVSTSGAESSHFPSEETHFQSAQVNQPNVPSQKSFIGQRSISETGQAPVADPYVGSRGAGIERLANFKSEISEIDVFPVNVKNLREAAWEILENRLKEASSQEEINLCLEDIDKEHAVDNKLQEALANESNIPALAVIETIGKAALKVLPKENIPEKVKEQLASLKEDFERLKEGNMNRFEMNALIKKGDEIFNNQDLEKGLLKKWEGFKYEAALNMEAFDVLLNADSNHSLDRIEFRERQLHTLKGTGVDPFVDSEFFDEGDRLLDELILTAYFDPSRKFHELNDQREAWNDAANAFDQNFPLLEEASQANQELKEALVEVYMHEINLKDVPGSGESIEQLDRIAEEHVSKSSELSEDLSKPENIRAYTDAAKESVKELSSAVAATKTKESVRNSVERQIASFQDEMKKEYLDVFDNLNSQYPSAEWVQKKNHIMDIMSSNVESMDSWAQKNYKQNFSDLRPDQMGDYENFVKDQIVRKKESIERTTGLQSALEAERIFSQEKELADATLEELIEEKKFPAALELKKTINSVNEKLDGIIEIWGEKPMDAKKYERALKESQKELEKAVLKAENAQKMSKSEELTALTKDFPDADETHRLKNEYYEENIQVPVERAMGKIEEYKALVDKLPNALKINEELRIDISRRIKSVEKEITGFQTPPENLGSYTGSDVLKLEKRVQAATKDVEQKLENAVHLNAVIEASQKLKTQIKEAKDIGSGLEEVNQFGKAKDLLNAISKAENRVETLGIPKTAKDLLTYKKEIEKITSELKKDVDAIPEENENFFDQLKKLEPDSNEAFQLRGQLTLHYQIKLDNFQKELWALADQIDAFEPDYLAFDPKWKESLLNNVKEEIAQIQILKELIEPYNKDVSTEELESCRVRVKAARQELNIAQFNELQEKANNYKDKQKQLLGLLEHGQEANADRIGSVILAQEELLKKQFKDKPISNLRQMQSAAKALEEAEGRLGTIEKTLVENEEPLEQLEYFEKKYGEAAFDKQGYQTVHKACQRQIHGEIDRYVEKLDKEAKRIQAVLIDAYNEDEKLVPGRDREWAEVTYFIDELGRKKRTVQELKEKYTQKNRQQRRGILGLRREKIQEKDIVLTRTNSSELREFQAQVKREIEASWANVEELAKNLPKFS